MRKPLLTAAAVLGAGSLVLGLPAAPAQAVGWQGVETFAGNGEELEIVATGPGDAVAAWLEGGRVRASSAVDGDWLAPVWVTPQGTVTDDLAIDANDDGDVVVAWVQDVLGDARVRAARRLSPTSWDGSVLVSPLGTDAVNDPEVAVTTNGTALVAVGVDAAGEDQVHVAEWRPGKTPVLDAFSETTDATAPSLDVNPGGAALVSWTDTTQGSRVRVARRTPGQGWGAPDDASLSISSAAASDVAIGDNGVGIVVFRTDDDGESRIQAVTVPADGLAGSPSYVSPAGEDADRPDLDVNASGRALAVWERTEDGDAGIGYASRAPSGGGWTAGVLNPAVADPAFPRARLADTGTQVLSYTGNDRFVVHHRTNPVLPFTTADLGADHPHSWKTGIDVDPEGNAVAGHARHAGDTVTLRFLDAVGPRTKLTGPKGAQVLSTDFPVTWTATDSISAVTGASVIVREAAWDSPGFSDDEVAVQAIGSPVGFEGEPGTTYCLQVQSKDAANNFGARSGERCTTVPVDDTALKGGKAWDRSKKKGHFAGTVTRTTDKGAKLTLAGVRAKRLALVVTRSGNGGSVKVTMGKKNLGTYGLQGKGRKKVVPVAAFGKVRSGTVTLTVVSPDGKQVAIDGLVVAK